MKTPLKIQQPTLNNGSWKYTRPTLLGSTSCNLDTAIKEVKLAIAQKFFTKERYIADKQQIANSLIHFLPLPCIIDITDPTNGRHWICARESDGAWNIWDIYSVA